MITVSAVTGTVLTAISTIRDFTEQCSAHYCRNSDGCSQWRTHRKRGQGQDLKVRLLQDKYFLYYARTKISPK